MAASDSDLDALKQWCEDYMAKYVDELYLNSSIFLPIPLDYIDNASMESQIQLAMSATQISQGFCHACRHLLDNWPYSAWEQPTCDVAQLCSTIQLEAACRNGCKFCSFLFWKLRDAELLELFRKIERRFDLLNSNKTLSISIFNLDSDGNQVIWLNFPGRSDIEMDFSRASRFHQLDQKDLSIGASLIRPFTVHMPSSTKASQVFITEVQNSLPYLMKTVFESHVMPPDSNCYKDEIDKIELAKGWLRICTQSHEACYCRKLQGPTRLISISDEAVKLVLTRELDTLPEYATLSYCWGSENFLKLTPDKVQSFLNSIPLDTLPKTFQDAIYITRRLGLTYIWIDALCIIQTGGDNPDWVRESGHMRSIYGGAYVNIAASSGKSVHDGCFAKPKNYCSGFSTQVTTNGVSSIRSFHSSNVYEDSTINSHLATRAWALQERLLAPRTIYFGKQDPFWECRTTIMSQFLPEGLGGHIPRLVCPEHRPWNWCDIVKSYSKGRLTRGTDKLPALAGIARRQYEVTEDDYLAGMWREHLVKQLEWKPVFKSERPRWRAPTWSWLSVDGEVLPREFSYRGMGNYKYVEVLNARVKLAGPDPFGAIENGELQLKCTALVRGRYGSLGHWDDDLSGDGVLFDSFMQEFPIEMDCLNELTGDDNNIHLLPLFEGGEGGPPRVVGKIGEHDSDISEGKAWSKTICGIVLQRSGVTKGRFRRVGTFGFRNGRRLQYEANHKNCHYYEFLSLIKNVGTSALEVECEYPGSPYIITIE